MRRFCSWYDAADAEQLAPSGAGIVQVKVTDGLLRYPKGRSAMVHYAATEDVRSMVAAIAAQHPQAPLVFRHIEQSEHLVALTPYLEKLTADFAIRFGCEPSFEPTNAKGARQSPDGTRRQLHWTRDPL